MAKDIRLQMWNNFAIWGSRINQKLRSPSSSFIEFAQRFYICKRISFTISNFAIIEEIASSQFVSSASEWSIVLDYKECKRKAIIGEVLEFE